MAWARMEADEMAINGQSRAMFCQLDAEQISEKSVGYAGRSSSRR